MRLVLGFTLLAALCAAESKVEIGEINGAKFRIDVPDNWNGGLVMYCHGYSTTPANFKPDAKPSASLEVFLSAGYAVAQSGYSGIGWAVQEAIDDTQALRRYFTARYGKPKETFITGQSMGAFTTMALIEKYPSDYDAALSLCGPLAPSIWYKLRTAFDTRVLYDYYFPGVLPSPVDIPANFERSKENEDKVMKTLEAKPEVAETLRHYTNIRTTQELANLLVFWTYQLMDMDKRSGGNPFDNRNTIYIGVPDNNTVNDGVKRYAADPRAAEYLRTYYTPTGHLTRPMLDIHTTYDPLVPPWIPNTYAYLTQNAGSQDLFVLQYVKHDGHCKIEPGEIGRAFQQLRNWKDHGERPSPGWNH